MTLTDFLGAIAQVNSAFSMAAFAIAAVLAILNRTLASADAVQRRGKRPPAVLANGLVWPLVVAICFLGALPIIAHTYLESIRLRVGEFYRVRVIVLEPDGRPLSGAIIRTPVANELSATSQNTAIITIPRASVPENGKVTIFADLDSAFLHGQAEVALAGDLNPTVTITTAAAKDATVTGLVQDGAGRAIAGARVMVLGGESGITSEVGSFTLKANAASGQMIRVHAEKAGYAAVDHDHPAGRQPVTIVLTQTRRRR